MDKILLKNILKIECHIYFDNSVGNYSKLNKKIRSRTMINMLCSYINNGKEVLLLMDNSSFRYKINTGDYKTVNLSDDMLQSMKRSNSTFTAFHNHPEETDFSLDDLKQLIMHDKIKLLILCTNSCRYCSAIYKPESFTVRETQALFHLFDKYMKKNNVDGHCDAKFFINKLQEQGKLLYYYAMNRRVKNETKTISSTYIK